MSDKHEGDAYFWLRTDATGRTELAPDVDGKPGEWGTDDIYLGTIEPMSRRLRRRERLFAFIFRLAVRIAIWARGKYQ